MSKWRIDKRGKGVSRANTLIGGYVCIQGTKTNLLKKSVWDSARIFNQLGGAGKGGEVRKRKGNV